MHGNRRERQRSRDEPQRGTGDQGKKHKRDDTRAEMKHKRTERAEMKHKRQGRTEKHKKTERAERGTREDAAQETEKSGEA